MQKKMNNLVRDDKFKMNFHITMHLIPEILKSETIPELFSSTTEFIKN
jgi:hypothetical protein